MDKQIIHTPSNISTACVLGKNCVISITEALKKAKELKDLNNG